MKALQFDGLVASMLSASGRREQDAAPLLWFAVMLSFALPAAAATFEVEPNNSPATASALTSGAGFVSVQGSISPGGDQDFFSFTAPAGARAWILVDTGGTPGPGSASTDSVLELRASNGTTLIETDDDDGVANGCDSSIESHSASAIAGRVLDVGGSYFLRVHEYADQDSINPYALYLMVTTSNAAPEVEMNDFVGAANPLVTGPGSTGLRAGAISVPGDIDIYSITTVVGSSFFVSVDADPERDGIGSNLLVDLIGPDGFTVLLAPTATGTGLLPAKSFCYAPPNSGTYYVRVRHAAGGTGTYHIMATSAGPGAFLFTGAVQTQVEGAGAALVTVHRLSGALGTVSVRVTSSNGTASAGSDYTAVNQILTFTNGVTSQTFSLPVADDGLIESNETVFLSLSNPTGGAVLAQPSTATLVILDNDEPLNNSAATAQPVVLNSAFASVLTGAGSVPLALSPFNDSDWFSFSAPANGRVWAMVDVGATSNPAANSGDSRLALLALDGSTVLEDDDDDGSATGCDGVLASDGGLAPALAGSAVGGAGTYYLRVDPVSTNAIIDPYHLLLAVTPAAVLAEGEPNDTANAATVLLDLATAVASRSAAIDGAGDIDYFAVAAPSNALLFVAADCDPERDGGTDLVVELLDVDGSTVLFSADSSSDEVAAAEAFCFRVGARGTYFLRVSHYDLAETGTYHIMAARDRTDLAVVWAHVEGANVRVRFTTESGVTYRVERANGIGSSWSTLPGSVSGTGNEGEYLDLGGAAGGQRFYRVRRGP